MTSASGLTSMTAPRLGPASSSAAILPQVGLGYTQRRDAAGGNLLAQRQCIERDDVGVARLRLRARQQRRRGDARKDRPKIGHGAAVPGGGK